MKKQPSEKQQATLWGYFIFNCCVTGEGGLHWRLMILPPPTASALHHIILFDSLALPLEAYMGSPALIRELGSLPVWMMNPVNVYSNGKA